VDSGRTVHGSHHYTRTMNNERLLTKARLPRLVAVFALLFSLYLLLYSGSIESGDSRYLFNTVASLYRYGDTRLDLSTHEHLPDSIDITQPYPLMTFDTEPMQPLLALPLYALADVVPGLGLVHTTWLFNSLITALTACVVLLYARALGGSERAATLTALAFGICTIAVPYSKTFFREPLSGFFLISAALAAERARAHGYLAWRLALFGALFAALLLTRASALMALPALVVILLPHLRTLPPRPLSVYREGETESPIALSRVVVAVVVLVLVVVGVFAYGILNGDARYNVLTRYFGERTYILTALHSYLLSIGGSIWSTSPVLLLAIPGVLLLWRRGWRRYALALPLLLLSFAGGYAFLSGIHWFGGLSWPPRFLVQIVPLLSLGMLPLIETALKPRRRALQAVILLLVAVSLWVQASAVSLRWGEYTRLLPDEASGVLEWGGGLNVVQYLRPVLIPQAWGSVAWDFAWARAGLPLWAYACVALLIACAAWLAWGIGQRRALAGSVGLLAGVMVCAGLCLRALYDTDYEYRASDAPLHELVAFIQRETTAGEVVLLSNPAFVDFFLNYAKLHNAARVVSLPLHPGDRPSPEQPPRVEDDNPDALVELHAIRLIYGLAQTRERIWLLENSTPALTWSVRPVERFLAAHYYPIRAIETSPLARLVEFSTVEAPDPFGFYSASRPSDLRFGDSLRLLGYDLPRGEVYAAGDALPVSLYWAADAPLTQDYTVALFLRAADGSPVTQVDVQPSWGFAPTTAWLAGVPVWDHRALRLPSTLPAGDYQLWLKVYGFDENFAPVDLPVTAGEALDGVIGVLDVRIAIDQNSDG
jgi:hypothetical protein